MDTSNLLTSLNWWLFLFRGNYHCEQHPCHAIIMLIIQMLTLTGSFSSLDSEERVVIDNR